MNARGLVKTRVMSHPIPIIFDTPGRIAEKLGVPLHRVNYVLNTRQYIVPSARAGRLRLFDNEAVACIRHELSEIDTQAGRGGVT